MIAQNAQKVIQRINAGHKVDDLLIVSLIGQVYEQNQTIFANPSLDYDWSWCAGLDIVVYAQHNVEWQKTVLGILASKPSFFAIWDFEKKEGCEVSLLPDPETIDKPRSQWKWFPYYYMWSAVENQAYEDGLCSL